MGAHTKTRWLHVGCPMCGHTRMSGSASAGYSCTKCRAQFSARFMRHLRRKHFQEIIKKSFSVSKPIPPPLAVDHIEVGVEEKFSVPVDSLEEYLDIKDAFQDVQRKYVERGPKKKAKKKSKTKKRKAKKH
ncbi:hypothetical protein GOV11_01655 [Candidatus Woesearchaeota archaeon]|nr:hypothetical protein [Candidatus Woesearchaeota archaeon]